MAKQFVKTSRRLQHLAALVCLVLSWQQLTRQVAGQGLPDDIQRELNQNLAEQARIQAMRARHQQQIQSRTGGTGKPGQQQAKAPPHDPNNYSYQQVSPPVQYSYYQPYGDVAAQPQAATGGSQQQQQQQQPPVQPINIDLNNLNFDLPTPQAQVSSHSPQQRQHLTPSFTGAGGLPVMQPVAATSSQAPPVDSFAPAGQAPLAPQARVQQGPPLTEADFKDITGGENYGAPGGSDFGMGANQAPAEPRAGPADNTDAQLREFGMPDEQQQQQQHSARRQSNPLAEFGAPSGGGSSGGGMPDFGAFNPLGGSGGGGGGSGASSGRRNLDSDPFAGFGGAGLGRQGGGSMPGQSGNEFDFASQPSSARGDQAQAAMQGGAPGSLQNLLGNSFPGLGGGSGANMGLDGLARGGGSNGAPEAQLPDFGGSGDAQQPSRGRADDNAMDVADLGDRADGFSGADLGGFEQPTPQNDQDYNYAAAAEQQPTSVPYPDGAPQPVGTLWALTQPQSLSQARYNALPDKGTYQSYPAYASGGNDFGAVASVVDETPRARPPGPGRYAHPSASQLAPEHRPAAGQAYDYGRNPLRSQQDDDVESSFISDAFD